jgi:hypothetical protein
MQCNTNNCSIGKFIKLTHLGVGVAVAVALALADK